MLPHIYIPNIILGHFIFYSELVLDVNYNTKIKTELIKLITPSLMPSMVDSVVQSLGMANWQELSFKLRVDHSSEFDPDSEVDVADAKTKVFEEWLTEHSTWQSIISALTFAKYKEFPQDLLQQIDGKFVVLKDRDVGIIYMTNGKTDSLWQSIVSALTLNSFLKIGFSKLIVRLLS